MFPPLRLAKEVIRMGWIKYELTACSISKYIMWKGGILGIFLVLHLNHQGSSKRKKSCACACPKL